MKEYDAVLTLIENGDIKRAREICERMLQQEAYNHIANYLNVCVFTNRFRDHEKRAMESAEIVISKHKVYDYHGVDWIVCEAKEIIREADSICFPSDLEIVIKNAMSFCCEQEKAEIREYLCKYYECYRNNLRVELKRLENMANKKAKVQRIVNGAERLKSDNEEKKKQKSKRKAKGFMLAAIGMTVLCIYFGGMVPEEAPISEGLYGLFMVCAPLFSVVAIKNYINCI